MRAASYIVLAVLALAGTACAVQPLKGVNGVVKKVEEPDWFCHGLDCPAYTVEDSQFQKDEIELRAYAAGKRCMGAWR
jgi:hypothetical protein